MSDPNYAEIHLELDDYVFTWNSIRTSWDTRNSHYDATNNEEPTGQNARCKIDLSHTHSVSGSTGGMSDPDYAKINFQLDDQIRTWNSTRSTWDVPSKINYDATSCRDDRYVGQDAYCTIDLSHTHSVSGSTGGMNSHSSGYMAGIIDNSDGITYDNDVFTNSGKGTYLGRRDSSYAYITKVTLNVSHTHSLSGMLYPKHFIIILFKLGDKL